MTADSPQNRTESPHSNPSLTMENRPSPHGKRASQYLGLAVILLFCGLVSAVSFYLSYSIELRELITLNLVFAILSFAGALGSFGLYRRDMAKFRAELEARKRQSPRWNPDGQA